MPIFRLERSEGDDMSKAELVIAQETNLELERHLEDWLENSPHALVENESILWIGRQTSAKDEDGTIYSDLFGVDFQGNLVIAELKKGRTPRDIIAQILDYAAWAVGLSESKIRETAEAYFEARGVFEEKTGEVVVSTEKIVGDEDFATPKKQQQGHPSSPPRPPSDRPIEKIILEAVQEFTKGDLNAIFTLKEIEQIISEKHPDLAKSDKVRNRIRGSCVDFEKRHTYSPIGPDTYQWVSRGKYRLYDPERDKA